MTWTPLCTRLVQNGREKVIFAHSIMLAILGSSFSPQAPPTACLPMQHQRIVASRRSSAHRSRSHNPVSSGTSSHGAANAAQALRSRLLAKAVSPIATQFLPHEIEGPVALQVVVGDCPAALHLLPGEEEPLVVGRDALFCLDLALQIVDGVIHGNAQLDGRPGQDFHHNLH
eukprot:CAMPEP_0179281334 /NCGR_PEP_ID=MMETSP0797-20121207/37098_1 /TAXON_ID=47934 /ORGANISM="Dinophysis acuminata, Strain DAEP01" /LENGTH=171 /DNA_ID=CAMNT_0020990035 /DNA_START=77 /DNA_END=594 /DNA_ORIENTATION=-